MKQNGRLVELLTAVGSRGVYDDSFIRVIDEGGLIWESGKAYETVAEALAEADAAIRRWADEEGL